MFKQTKHFDSQQRPTSWKGFHVAVNSVMCAFVESKKGTYVPLGPLYASMTYDDAERNLILHRLCKKFEVPDNTTAKDRKHKTVMDMFQFDDQWAVRWFQPARDRTLDGFTRRQLYLAREELRENVRTLYRLSVDNIGFPSGESVVSSAGDVSLYAKMRDRRYFTCTESCFMTFCGLAFQHAGLRHAVKRHFNQLAGNYKRDLDNVIWTTATSYNSKKPNFWAFVAKCRYVTTFVDSARITTVRKDNSKDRVIELDAFCNMVTQRTIAGSIRNIIRDVYDIDLDESQVTHKLLIQDLCNATIDLSNASNSVWYSVVEWFLDGTKLWSDLKDSRCGLVSFEGTKYPLNMLAPMGNGFTFEIMTLLLLTVSRQFDSFAHVFGDDIICDRDVAQPLMRTLEYLGFHMNAEKTFMSGNFRESCGGFTCNGKFITSFDFEWCEDEVDAVTLINKIGTIAHSVKSLKDEFTELHRSLLGLVPAALLKAHTFSTNYSYDKIIDEAAHFYVSSFNRHHQSNNSADGPLIPKGMTVFDSTACSDSRFDLSVGVLTDMKYVLKAQRACTKCRVLFTHEVLRTQRVDLNWDVKAQSPLRGATHVTLVLRKTNKRYTYQDSSGRKRPWKPIDNVSRLISFYYLFAGRTLSPTFRETRVSVELTQHHVAL